ncbi:MAG: DUF4252 domain-containing protein [Dysgonamonadaceae bacterium]|jgi:hypothetical protein|nr:DUF4252 domain-containing protein [Dysgonamonadaceae bacterium]
MKKIVCFGLLATLVSLSSPAQTPATVFLEKYGTEDNLQAISIGEKMFDRIKEQDLGSPELLNAIEGLENIQIIASKDTDLSKEYYNAACLIMEKSKDLTEVYSVKNDNLQLLVKVRETKGVINELIIVSEDSKGFSLINLTGDIDLELLAGYSSSLNFEELKKLPDN